MNYPKSRLRRLRYNKNIRSLVQDVQLNISDLIYPIFICFPWTHNGIQCGEFFAHLKTSRPGYATP